MADISKISLDGNSYDIKDTTARSDVSSLNTRVTALEHGKHLIIIGDSFSTTNYNPAETAWYTIVARKLGLIVHNYAQSGAGYVKTSGGTNKNFSNEVDDAIADTSYDHDDVAMIIVYGGLNDMNSSYVASIGTNAAALCDKINTNFPKAQVVIMGINAWANSYNKVNNENQLYYFLQIRKACATKGVAFVNTCLWLRSSEDSNEYYDSTTNHPNVTGNSVIASSLLTALYGNSVIPNTNDYQLAVYDTTTTGSGSISISANTNYITFRGNATTDANGKTEWSDSRKIFSSTNTIASFLGSTTHAEIGFFAYNANTGVITFNGGGSGAANKTYYFRGCIPLL